MNGENSAKVTDEDERNNCMEREEGDVQNVPLPGAKLQVPPELHVRQLKLQLISPSF